MNFRPFHRLPRPLRSTAPCSAGSAPRLDSAEGDFERALAGYREALAAIRTELPDDDYRIGRSLFNIASMEQRLGRVDEAFEHAGEALAILRKRKGQDAATVQQVEELLRVLSEARGAQR